jgi:hypothetical protein
MLRKLLTFSYVFQFTNGKISMLFSGLTAATVLSMKFHIPFLYVLAGCSVFVILATILIIKTGWINMESERVNELSGVMNMLKKIDEKLDGKK